MNIHNKEVIVIPAKTTKEKKIRVAAYCRVSTDSTDQLNSFFTQMKYYSDYIKSNPEMIFVDIYADEGITGTSLSKREEMKRLIKDCRLGKIDRVLVKSVTRFARNALECIEIVRKLKEEKVNIYFENDKINTENMSSEIILYIKSAFAEAEVVTASKRMAKSNQIRMENGNFKTTTAPYGYCLSEKGLEIIPEEAEKIKLIYELYLSGLGANQIIRRLKELGDKKDWKVGQIRYILENEKYIGDSLFQKSFTPHILPFKQKTNNGELPKYYYTNTQEPIISKEKFVNAQVLRKNKREIYYKNTKKKTFVFSKILKCRKCGWSYRYKNCESGIYWSCSKKGKVGCTCQSGTYKMENLYQSFVSMYNILKNNEKIILDETIHLLQIVKAKKGNSNQSILQIDNELASLSEQYIAYSELYQENIIDEITYMEKKNNIQGRSSELRSRRMRILNEDDDENEIEELRKVKRILDKNENYITCFDEKLFHQLVDKIYAEEDKGLTFLLKGNLELKLNKEVISNV